MIEEIMTKYAELKKTYEKYKEVNSNVFQVNEEMLSAISQTEEEIKALAKEAKKDFEHAGVKVTYVQPYSKWYDFQALTLKTQKLLEKLGAIKHTVNKETFEEMVRNKEISREEQAKAFVEEEQTPRALIKLIPQE